MSALVYALTLLAAAGAAFFLGWMRPDVRPLLACLRPMVPARRLPPIPAHPVIGLLSDTPPEGFEVVKDGGRIRVGAHERGIQPRRSGVQPWDTAPFAPLDPEAEEAREAFIRDYLEGCYALHGEITAEDMYDAIGALRLHVMETQQAPAVTGAPGGCTGLTGELEAVTA